MKDFFRGMAVIGIIAAFALCVIGATGYLIYDSHYLFAIAEIVVSAFAAKPMLDKCKSFLA